MMTIPAPGVASSALPRRRRPGPRFPTRDLSTVEAPVERPWMPGCGARSVDSNAADAPSPPEPGRSDIAPAGATSPERREAIPYPAIIAKKVGMTARAISTWRHDVPDAWRDRHGTKPSVIAEIDGDRMLTDTAETTGSGFHPDTRTALRTALRRALRISTPSRRLASGRAT